MPMYYIHICIYTYVCMRILYKYKYIYIYTIKSLSYIINQVVYQLHGASLQSRPQSLRNGCGPGG